MHLPADLLQRQSLKPQARWFPQGGGSGEGGVGLGSKF